MKNNLLGWRNTLSAIKILILIFGIISNAKADQQQNYYTPQQSSHLYQDYPTIPSAAQKSQYVIFNAIGEMASQMMYIHVSLPLNISTLYDQANLFESYLLQLKNTTTSEIKRIPFTKAARDTGEYALKRLERIMKKLKEIDDNLPHQEGAHIREERRREKRSLALWDYRRDNFCIPGRNWDAICQEEHDTFFHERQIKKLEAQINNYFEDRELSKFPKEYLEVYTGPETPVTTTFRPFIPGKFWDDESKLTYLKRKLAKLNELIQPILKEEMELKTNGTKNLPEFYIRHRAKRFAQVLAAVNNVVGTFMGAFNAYEIRQLNKKFEDLSQGHNMLVRVTHQHENDIVQMHKSLRAIVKVIDLMAEYNPGLLQLKISEQLDIFENRVTVITNTIQQLHHHRLAIDLLSPEQMNIMHKAVQNIATEEKYNSQAKLITDYYQIEVSYTRTLDDIIVMVHVPCIKSRSLLTIYRYLPFPIPLPIQPKGHDFTIKHSLQFQESSLTKAKYDEIFDTELNFPQHQEALFVTDSTDLIAIDDDKNFQVLTQTDLAKCVQRNHVFLCDKQNVVKHELTDTCLGSLYVRNENGVRQHCTFERKAVQETVFQLSDTEHIVYSPKLQTSAITCKNGTSETIHLNLVTKVNVPENCQLKLLKHTIRSSSTTREISSKPLQYAWTWDPLNLPSTLLENPQHLDHMINELRNQIYNVNRNATDPEIFQSMLIESTFSHNYTSILIWLSLSLASALYFILFITAFIMYLKHKRSINPRHPIPQQPTIAMEPLVHQLNYQHQNQALLQELGNALVQHHTTRPSRLNPT